MTPADALQSKGFTAMLTMHGTKVTFRGASATVLINRLPVSQFPAAEINIASPDGSTILIAGVSEPKQGEVFLEGTTQHSVFAVRNLGYAWECKCNINRPE
jgi:hypothetical protein